MLSPPLHNTSFHVPIFPEVICDLRAVPHWTLDSSREHTSRPLTRAIRLTDLFLRSIDALLLLGDPLANRRALLSLAVAGDYWILEDGLKNGTQ